jgi:hypothetical protein
LNDGQIQNPSNSFGIVPLSNFVRRGFGFVHHSIPILYHKVPNPYLTIRNFFIAVRAAGFPLPGDFGYRESGARRVRTQVHCISIPLLLVLRFQGGGSTTGACERCVTWRAASWRWRHQPCPWRSRGSRACLLRETRCWWWPRRSALARCAAHEQTLPPSTHSLLLSAGASWGSFTHTHSAVWHVPASQCNRHVPCRTQRTHATGLWAARMVPILSERCSKFGISGHGGATSQPRPLQPGAPHSSFGTYVEMAQLALAACSLSLSLSPRTPPHPGPDASPPSNGASVFPLRRFSKA